MLNLRFFSRRRRQPAWPFLLAVVLFTAAQYELRGMKDGSVVQEAWEGRLVRVYRHQELKRRSRGPEAPWWEVKTTEGRYRSINVRSWQL
jgi:hypothetical protein